MAIEFVGASTATGASGSFNVDLTALSGGIASAAAEGDLVIVATGFVQTSNLDPGVSTSGFAEIADLYANDTRDANLSVSWKIMTSTPDTSVACNGSGSATNGAAAIAYVLRGIDPATPLDVTATTATSNNSAVFNSPSITPVTSGALVLSIGLGTGAAADTTITAPTGYSDQSNVSTDPGNAVIIGVASKAWTSGAEDPAAWTGVTTSTSDSWAAVTVAVRPLLPHDLTATDLATGAPTVGSPAITQVHVLTATGISTGAPTVGAPELTENSGSHDLTANSIATGAPTVGSPAITQAHGLTATGIATGAPTVGSPAITQAHALAANGVATGAPTVGSPAITQAHGLTAIGIATGAPTVGAPELTENDNSVDLTANGIVTGAPTVGTPALSQAHALTAAGVATGAPSVGSPALTQAHGLSATGIATGAPTTGAPAISQTHALEAVGIATGAPTVGTPGLNGGTVDLVANGISTGAPTMGSPALSTSGRKPGAGGGGRRRRRWIRIEDQEPEPTVVEFPKPKTRKPRPDLVPREMPPAIVADDGTDDLITVLLLAA